MNTPKLWTHRSHLMVMGAVLLSVLGQASPARSGNTLAAQMAALSGTGLTGAECGQRMQALGSLLQKAGYRSLRTGTLEDGPLLARWYHTGRHTTALAFSGQNSIGNTFWAGEYAGLLRWNELRGAP